MGFVANFLCFPAVKAFWRSVNIGKATAKIEVARFHGTWSRSNSCNCIGTILHLHLLSGFYYGKLKCSNFVQNDAVILFYYIRLYNSCEQAVQPKMH